ncbi:MAG: hypothetical protein JWP81_4685 [Ferruginibacter sp.]|nr:hypothetical protein [Ferruginibacter sp.]
MYEYTELDTAGFLMTAYQHLGVKYPKFYKMDHLSKLGWLAAEFLLKASFESARYAPEQVGIILTNANSSLDADLKYFESAREFASPALFVYTLPNIVIGEICIKHNFKGENAFFIFEEFDAGFIQKYVSGLMNSNILQACICGWVECIGEEYKAVLFFIEKGAENEPSAAVNDVADDLFTTDNLNKIYHSDNG